MPRGGLELTVQASGYETATRRNLSVQSDIELQLELGSYPSFAVRVVDQAGRPVDNARVHGVDHRNRSIMSRRPDGRYFTKVYPVRIYADALSRNLGVSTEILVESYQPQVDLVLQPGCTLKGRVVGDDGDPLNSFVVSIQPSGMGSLSRRIYAEDGSFDLRDLPSGQVTISVSATGFERFRSELTLEDVRASWLEVVLSPRQRRRGRDGGGISQGRGGRRQPGPGPVTLPES